MYKNTSRFAAAALLVASAPAFADPGPEDGQTGGYATGVVELEYNFNDDYYQGFLGRADARAGVLNAGNGALQFGFELGIDAYDLEGRIDLTGLQAIGYAVTDIGTFSVGAPFSVDADFGPETVFDRSVMNYVIMSEAQGSAQTLIQNEPGLTPGGRYDGSFGAVDVGLSFHEFNQERDGTAIVGAASYSGSFFTLTGEAGYFDLADANFDMFSLSAESNYGPIGGSIEVSSIDGDRVIYTLEGSYAVSDQFAVAAGLKELDLSGGGPDTSWLVEAQYGFGNGAFISATGGRTLGNGEAAVGVGLEF